MSEETRPEPVLDQGRIAAVVGGAVVAVVGLVLLIVRGQAGDLTALQIALEGVLTSIMAAAAVIAPLWRARKARDKVTPLEDPRTADGVPLVPLVPAPAGPYTSDPETRTEVTGYVDTRTPGTAAHAAPEG